MATITPANLAYKDKDGDLGEVKSLTDTDVTLLNNALQDIEDLKLAYMPGYVKRDFSNVTQDGKDASISWVMPDYSAGVDITSQISTTYSSVNIPSDGLLVMIVSNPSTAAERYILVDNNVFLGAYASSGTYVVTSRPILKGSHTMRSDFALSVAASVTFYPCKGAN